MEVGPAIAFRRDPNCIAGAGQKDAVADVIVGNNAGSESEFVLKFDPIAKVFAGFAVRRHVKLAKEHAVPTVAVSDAQNYEVVAILQLDTGLAFWFAMERTTKLSELPITPLPPFPFEVTFLR